MMVTPSIVTPCECHELGMGPVPLASYCVGHVWLPGRPGIPGCPGGPGGPGTPAADDPNCPDITDTQRNTLKQEKRAPRCSQ